MWNRNACIPDIDQIHSNPGSRVHDLLEPRFDGEVTRLVKTGEEDIQDLIEAAAPFTDINYMLHRLSLGDRSVLNARSPIYGDVSELPRDPIEALNLVQRSEDAFMQLSMDDRAKYNNDWQRWFAAILSGDASRETISADTTAPPLLRVSQMKQFNFLALAVLWFIEILLLFVLFGVIMH